MSEIITCLSCWYKSIEWPRWSYDICDICGREDDIYWNNNPYKTWGANKISLKESQEKFLAKEKDWKVEKFWFQKDSKWIPLWINNKQDIIKKSYFNFVTEEEPKDNYLWL